MPKSQSWRARIPISLRNARGENLSSPFSPLREANRIQRVASRSNVCVREAPCKLIRGWNKYCTALALPPRATAAGCARELPMKVSPNERRTARERKRTRRNAGRERDARRRDRRERNSERRRGGDGETWETCRVAFHQSQMLFFQFPCSSAPGSRDVSPPLPHPSLPLSLYSSTAPLVPLSSVLVVRASWCPPVSPYTPHSSSLLSYLPLPP